MRVRIRYFASFRDLTGCVEETLDLAEGSTVEAMMAAVKRLHEPMSDVDRVLVAVNSEFAEPGQGLGEGDAVALFPPVSGG